MAKAVSTRDPKWESAQPEVYKFENVGESLEGVYLSHEGKEIDHQGKQIRGARYYFHTEGGPKMVWGAAVLDSQMKFVRVGSEVRIEFEGLGEAKSGQSAPKMFKVFHVPPEGDQSPF